MTKPRYPLKLLFQSRKIAGKTNSVSSTELIIPPTIGAAIRLITSEPVPVP
jgi:hypothetical protein